jgi:signal transduction histidine kinase
LGEAQLDLDAEAPRFRRLRKLTQVSRALSHATSLDQVLSLTVAEAALLLDGSRAALLLYDDDGHLQVRATHAIAEGLVPRDSGAPSPALEDLLAQILGDAFERDGVAVPLIVGGKVTGALAVLRGDAGIAEEEEEWLLSSLADQTMLAVEKERLGEAQGRARKRELIARVENHLLARHDVQSLFDEVTRSVCATLEVDLAGIFAHRPGGGFDQRSGWGWPSPAPTGTLADADPTTGEARALDAATPVVFGDSRPAGADVRSAARALDPRIASGIVVAIDARRRFGVLGVYARSHRTFTQEEVDLIASLAALLSSALDLSAAEAQIQAAAAMRDDLLAIVSHDLRNPLFAIISAAALLGDDDVRADDASLAHCVGIIERNGRRMASMIKDLLDFEGLRGGGLSVAPSSLAVGPLLAETLEMIQPQARERSQQLTLVCPDGVTAWFDRERTLQVLSNLVGNAVKFTPEGGTVTLTAEPTATEVVISVRDTGPGIPPDDVAHVFDRYWQAKRADRRGIGLGLPIAKGLVEAQGGRLWVESEPGRGTTFFFTLPARDVRRIPS